MKPPNYPRMWVTERSSFLPFLRQQEAFSNPYDCFSNNENDDLKEDQSILPHDGVYFLDSYTKWDFVACDYLTWSSISPQKPYNLQIYFNDCTCRNDDLTRTSSSSFNPRGVSQRLHLEQVLIPPSFHPKMSNLVTVIFMLAFEMTSRQMQNQILIQGGVAYFHRRSLRIKRP